MDSLRTLCANLYSAQQSRLERGGLDVYNFGTLVLASKLLLQFESLMRAAVQWEIFSMSQFYLSSLALLFPTSVMRRKRLKSERSSE